MSLLLKSISMIFVVVYILVLSVQDFYDKEKNQQVVQLETMDEVNESSDNKMADLEAFIQNELNLWGSGKTKYEKNGFKFASLTLDKVNQDQSLIDGIESQYKKIKKVEKMQKLAIHIAKTYNVNLKLSEDIVFHSYINAHKNDLEPLLIVSLIGVESTFNPESKSSYGAIGLTQVVPRFHQAKINSLSQEQDLWNVKDNIKVGTSILKEYLIKARGDLRKALQMYNGTLEDEEFKYSNKIFTKLNYFKNVIDRT